MSRDGRKPWMIPLIYEEDRFPDTPSRVLSEQIGGELKPDPDLIRDRVENPQQDIKPAKPRSAQAKIPHTAIDGTIEPPSTQRRPNWRDAGGGRSNDDRPLNYSKGPHGSEIDVEDRDDPNYD